MQSNNKKKICIVVSSLGKGGAERLSAILSKILYELGYEVSIVTVLNYIDYEYSGNLLNLGELKDADNSVFGRYNRLKVFKSFLKKEKFDLIIDSRSRPTILKEWLISKLLYKKYKVLYIVHSWKLDMYLSKSKFWARRIYKNASGFVSVSKEIGSRIKRDLGFDNVSTIYNTIDIEQYNQRALEEISVNFDYVLFYGRLDDKVKNIALLIDAYNKSELFSVNIKLLILGDGPDEKSLKQKYQSDNVVFKPFTSNPFPYIKNAKFCLLTSRFEGFPLVILESLSIGIPVISVDCNSGPKEVIIHNQNGLLVKNHDVEALANAMNNLIFDEQLYARCKENAKQSVSGFSIENISNQWEKVIEKYI